MQSKIEENENIKSFYCKINMVIYNLIAVILVILVILSIKKIVTSSDLDKVYLKDNWKIIYKDYIDNKVDLGRYKLSKTDKNDLIVIERKIKKSDFKDIDYKDIGLFIQQSKVCVKVWLDDKLVYENSNDKGVFLVHFKKEYMGKKLRIEYKILENNYFSSIKIPSFIDESKYVSNALRNNFVNLFVAGFFMIYGIVAFILAICTRNKNMFMKRVTLTGTFMLCICMWLLSNHSAFNVFLDRIVYKDVMNYYSIYFGIPIFVIIMYTFIEDKKFKFIYKVVTIVITVVSTVATIVTLFDRAQLSICKIILEMLALLAIAWCIYSIIKDSKKRKASDKYLMVSLAELALIMVIESIIYAVKFMQSKDYNTSIIMEVGLVVYIAMMVFAYVKYAEEIVNNHIEKSELSNQAYQDMLTGLYNRIKVMEMIDELRTSEKTDYTIINFDLNNLKKINDANGHIIGDKYLKSFSKTIKDLLKEQFNVIGRVGGDEFVAIADIYIRPDNLEKSLKKVSKDFEKICEKDLSIEGSFAYGYVSSNKKTTLKIDDAYKKADEMMYECKRKQKE